MLLFLLFLLGSFSAGIAHTDNSYVSVKNLTGADFDLRNVNLKASLNTNGNCSSFLICYDGGMAKSNGKLAKRFQLLASKANMPEEQCGKQHWAKLSKSNENETKITEFSFGFKDLSVADLTLEDLDDAAKMEGAFLADNGCESLQQFALELHLAKNVNIWKKNCEWEWEFSNENGTTPKQPVQPTDGPNISPVSDSPKVSESASSSPTSTASTTTTSSTTTTVTTTTEVHTTTKEPVDWTFQSASQTDATFGTGMPKFSTNSDPRQYVLFVRGIIEPWAQSMVLNMSIHGCHQDDYEPTKCDKWDPVTNVDVQFGVSFDQDGKAECWLKAIENSKLVDTGGFCNGSGLFKRGDRFDLFFGMFNGDGNTDGTLESPVNFNVKLGGIGIGEYTRPGLYTPIMGGYSAKLHGSVRPVPNVPKWALPIVNYAALDEDRLEVENLQIFGYVPLRSQKFEIHFKSSYFASRATARKVAFFHVDMKAKQISVEFIKHYQTTARLWAPDGPFPSGFVEGENFQMQVVKKSCQEWWIWEITVNNVTFTLNANTARPGGQLTHLWAQFIELQIRGDMVYYRHDYLPAKEENCVPTSYPMPTFPPIPPEV